MYNLKRNWKIRHHKVDEKDGKGQQEDKNGDKARPKIYDLLFSSGLQRARFDPYPLPYEIFFV